MEGKHRKKRLGRGVNLDDDSDEDGEEDQNQQIRRRMSKKRRIEGDNLEALGQTVPYRPRMHQLIFLQARMKRRELSMTHTTRIWLMTETTSSNTYKMFLWKMMKTSLIRGSR